MAVYLINIFLILIFGYLFLYKNKCDKNTKIYCTIVALQWILLSGLRHKTIGRDTAAYYSAFERAKSTSWPSVLSDIWNYLFNDLSVKDPGYELVEKIFQIFSGDYQIYLLFIAVLFTALMAIWIYKNSKDPCFSFILYSTLFYAFYAITGHRQTIATALIVFWGYKYIKERKPVKFALLAFIAFLIHKSSIAFVPYYFIANIPITLPYVVIALVVISVIVVSGKGVYAVIADWLGFSEELINYSKGGAETYAAVLTVLCIVILIFYYFYKNKTENAARIFNITLLTLMSSLLVFQNQSFMRIQQYYSLFLCVSFPEVILSFKKESRALVYVFTMLVLILYLLIQNPQYLFFWQEV